MNANSFKIILNSTVSISDLTRAGAKKIFDSLNEDESKIVMKNNKPVAALVSTDRYQELLEKEEDLQLIQLSLNRLSKNKDTITREDFFKNNGITEDFLSDLPAIDLE
ncbi:type II toxin-antitoxin system Phd/YefM family antitoxin [Amedibacillus sp. YH-ame6]